MLLLETGSRLQSRLSIHLPAIVTTAEGTHRVVLADLSVRGARLQGCEALRVGQPILLQWHTFQVLGQVRWRDQTDCGVTFDRALRVSELFETRDLAPGATLTDREVVRRNAEAFVNGRVRL